MDTIITYIEEKIYQRTREGPVLVLRNNVARIMWTDHAITVEYYSDGKYSLYYRTMLHYWDKKTVVYDARNLNELLLIIDRLFYQIYPPIVY